jgi:cytidylate kinase
MKIAISSFSGAGTTTACRKVSEALGLKIVNYTMRQIAAERGSTLAQIQEEAELDDKIDYLIDGKLMELSGEENSITGSRLACWLVDADLYVWLAASDEIRAARRAKEDKIPFEAALSFTKHRDETNAARYKRLYGIDVFARPQVDIEINTDKFGADQVAAIIISLAKTIGASRPRRNPWSEKIREKIRAAVG